MKIFVWDRARGAFIAGVVLLVACALAAGYLIVELENSNRRVLHAFEIQVSLENLESSIAAAGRARVLYATTRLPQYLEDANAKIESTAAQMRSILVQTQDIPTHHDSYSNIDALINARIAIIRASLKDAQAGIVDSSIQDQYTQQIVVVADKLKTELENLESHESRFAVEGTIV